MTKEERSALRIAAKTLNYKLALSLLEKIPVLLDAMEEAEAWNDTDCNTCPLRSWEKCDGICVSKLTMAEYMVKLADDIDTKLDALLKAEAENDALRVEAVQDKAKYFEELVADRDRWRARAEALERAIHGRCEYCAHNSNKGAGIEYCRILCSQGGWQFDEARFAESEAHP